MKKYGFINKDKNGLFIRTMRDEKYYISEDYADMIEIASLEACSMKQFNEEVGYDYYSYSEQRELVSPLENEINQDLESKGLYPNMRLW